MKFPSPVVSVYQVAHDALVRRAFLRTLRTPFVISHKQFLHSVSSPDEGASRRQFLSAMRPLSSRTLLLLLPGTDGVFIVEHEGNFIAFPDPKVVYPQEQMLSDQRQQQQKQSVFSLPTPDDVKDSQALQSVADMRYQTSHRIFDDDDEDEDGDGDLDEQARYRANNSIVLDDGKVCLVKGLHFIEKSTIPEPEAMPFGQRGGDKQAESTQGEDKASRHNDTTDSLGRIVKTLDALGIGMASVISSVLTMASMGLIIFIYASARRVKQQQNPERTAATASSAGTSKRSRRKASRSTRKNAQNRNEDEASEEAPERDEAGDDNGDEGEESGNARHDESDGDEDEPAKSREKRKKRAMMEMGAKSRSTPVMPSERINTLGEDGVLRVGQLGTPLSLLLSLFMQSG
jgi:hypothetical protein